MNDPDRNEPTDIADTATRRPATAAPADESQDCTATRDGTDPMRRRPFLKTISGPLLAAGLAGCPFGSDEATEAAPGSTPGSIPATGESAAYGDVVRFGDSYRMSASLTDPSGSTIETSGRFHGQDHHLRIETGDGVQEVYAVDGDSYVVTDGECVTYPGTTAELGEESAAAGPTGRTETDSGTDSATTAAASPALRRTGSTTIDGQAVAVLSLPAGTLPGYDEALTYYVESETRYLRRLEGPFGTVDYGSWGAVEPISPPDLDCRDLG